MSVLRVELDGDWSGFRPGDQIHGTVHWILDEIPTGLEVRLFWYTLGKGDTDVEIVAALPVAGTAKEGSQEFTFSAPPSPFSFSGKLISLIWAIEVVVLPGGDDAGRQIIAISATGEEILLDSSEQQTPEQGE